MMLSAAHASAASLRTDRVVIAGLPRSGTTYVGKILSAHPELRMVLEPLNEEFGLRSVPGQYPYVGSDGTDADRRSAELLNQMVDLGGGWRRFAISRDKDRSVVRNAVKLLIGSQTSWAWRRDRLAEQLGLGVVPVQCFKDPFSTFAVDYLAAEHHIRSVCLVRHPAAYYQSFVAQPWKFGVSRLMNADAMRADLGAHIDSSLWDMADHDKVAYCATMWKMMAKGLASSDPGMVLVVRHEDLCLDVAGVTQRVAEHFDLEVTPEMRSYIGTTSTGTAVAPEYRRVRSFVRDSKAVVDHWRSTIDPAVENELEAFIGDDLHAFYEAW